jgi:hypothetical protein
MGANIFGVMAALTELVRSEHFSVVPQEVDVDPRVTPFAYNPRDIQRLVPVWTSVCRRYKVVAGEVPNRVTSGALIGNQPSFGAGHLCCAFNAERGN